MDAWWSNVCLHPLRTLLLGSAGIAGLLAVADRTYLRREGRRERLVRATRAGGIRAEAWGADALAGAAAARRARAAVLVLVSLAAAVYARAFSQACAAASLCGVAWDLNCSPANRALLIAGQVVGVVAALAVVTRQILHASRGG